MIGKFIKIIKIAKTQIKLCFIKIFSSGTMNISHSVLLDGNAKLKMRGKGKLKLGYGVCFNRNCDIRVFNGGKLTVSDGCTFNNNCYIASCNNIYIGKGTIFGPNCVVVDHDHDYTHPGGLKELKYKTGEIKIGSNVWVAANVVILKNTVIGDNAVIGAGCVVSGNIPANTVLIQQKTNVFKEFSISQT